jgi:hypothetical protein
LRLLTLFETYQDKWKSRRMARAAQNLLSVSFSLWRAAFLADKSGHRTEVFASAMAFLERIVADNAIAYAQDRQCNEWTFNYYTKNASAALQDLATNWPKLLAPYEARTRSPTERWTYCQDSLDKAITAFEGILTAPSPSAAQGQRSATREAAKQRRKMSREFTLAAKRGANESK